MAESRFVITVDSSGAILSLQNLGTAVEQFDSKVKVADGSIRAFEQGVSSFRRAVLGVQSILGGFGIAELVRDLIKVNTEFERVRFSLLSSSDTAAAAAANFTWLRNVAVNLGTPLSKVGLEYARLSNAARGTALEGDPIRQVFTSVAQASQVMGLSNINTSRTFLALTEMISKGVVQAKEARRQFGQDLPGGFRILAEAAGFTGVNGIEKFTQAITKGSVSAIDTLKNLPAILNAKFGPAFEAAFDSPQRAMGSFKQAFDNMLYDIGQKGGFMREFVGMLHDLTNALTNDGASSQLTKLSEGLGNLMGVVRGGVKVIVDNLQLVTAAFLGLSAGSLILGLKGLVGWMGKLAGVSEGATLVGALLNPWVLLATLIGGAVAALVMFNDTIVKMFGYSANALDWMQTGFEMLGDKIADSGQKLLKWIEGIPVVGPILQTLIKDATDFFNTLDGFAKGGFSTGPGVIMNAFQTNFADILGPIEAAFAPVWQAIKTTALQTFDSLRQNLVEIFKEITSAFGLSFDKLPETIGGFFKSDMFRSFIVGVQETATLAISIFFGMANAIGAIWKASVDIILISLTLINPVVETIYDSFTRLGDGLANQAKNVDPLTEAFAIMGQVATGVWDLLTIAVQDFVIALTLVSSIVGAVITGVTGVVEGVYNAFDGLFDLLGNKGTQSAKATSDSMTDAANTVQKGWVQSIDMILGAIIAFIKGIGLIVEAVGALIGTIFDLGARADAIFKGVIDGALALGTQNNAGVAKAGQELADALTTPIKNRFQDVLTDSKNLFNPDNSDYHVMSKAIIASGAVGQSMGSAQEKITQGFRNFQENLKDPTEYKSTGMDAAGSYWDGFTEEWGKRASDLTSAKDLQAQKLGDFQREKAAAEAQAWADQNAAVDRDARPEMATKPGKKTPAQRAAEMIVNLHNQQTTDNNMTASAMNNPVIDDQSIKAIQAAQEALKSTGLALSYGQAQAQGGIAKKLADTAFAASLAKQKLEDYGKAELAIAKNDQAVAGYQEQIDLTKNLTLSNEQLKESEDAQKALRENGFHMTVQQALALDSLGHSSDQTARQLVITTMQTTKLASAFAIAGEAAKTMRVNMQTQAEFAAFGTNVSNSTTDINALNAEFTAQHAVMTLLHEDIFDATQLADPWIKSIYDQAKALSLVGGSASTYANSLKKISDDYGKTFTPVATARSTIQDQGNAQLQSLTAGFNLQQAGANKIINDPNSTVEQVQKATDQLQQGADIFKQAQTKLTATVQQDLIHNSNNFSDAFVSSVNDFGRDATNVGAEIQKTFNSAFSAMTDMLVTFVTTGKLNFQSFATSVLADIARMIIKFLEWKALQGIVNTFLPGVGNLIPQFAMGGIMTSGGPMPLNRYANGGVATSPQLAMYGEGSKPEAYVPLPDGRTIPVTLMGGSGGQDPVGMSMAVAAGVSLGLTSAYQSPALRQQMMQDQSSRGGGGGTAGNIEFHSHIDLGNSGAGRSGDPASDAKFADQLSKKVGEQMRQQVIDVVQNELRPGGTFNPMGSNKARF